MTDIQVFIARVNDKNIYEAKPFLENRKTIFSKQSLYIEGHKNERVHFIMFPLNFEINVQNNGNLVFMYQRVSLCLKKYYRLYFETSKLLR